MELKDRLKKARKAKNLSQSSVAESIEGLSQSAYSQLESGRSKATNKMAELANLFGVSAYWLATGQGEMTAKPTIDELRLKMDEIQGKVNGVERANPVKMLPVINEVQAGYFTDIGDDSYDEYRPAHHKGSYWLKIKGDSMTPEFRQGDLVLVDKERIATTGNYVVALIEGDAKATFKKYRECFDDGKPYYQLIALNDFYPIIDSRAKPFEVIGVVVEHNRGLV
ncbi:helix-turn-helix domain-containing protein [Moraxella bovis]|uniref:helix-turn-helix domain-containing protein n=1 Tax=Moraxella bovis TaxID=476 RepID=UPI0022275091|nr:S24 family peptidase [Moraxella bovis]UYZ90748.1 helix-turn-helix domain-containing protein [Moraxella bovis]UYZ94482.1 helix-turn-helix domain-containing protein [Moraxella bovis]UZA58552.1 helix-turn-helix domain-containing protein [Moraxella bovis]